MVARPIACRRSWGGARGVSVSGVASLLDVLPTVCDALGLPTPDDVQGRSLLPLLRGDTTKHRDRIFLEYSDNAEAAVRTQRYKLIYASGGRQRQDGYATATGPERRVQLFDLHRDPRESTNLADRPDHRARVDELMHALADHLEATAPAPRSMNVASGVEDRLRQAVLPVEFSPLPQTP